VNRNAGSRCRALWAELARRDGFLGLRGDDPEAKKRRKIAGAVSVVVILLCLIVGPCGGDDEGPLEAGQQLQRLAGTRLAEAFNTHLRAGTVLILSDSGREHYVHGLRDALRERSRVARAPEGEADEMAIDAPATERLRNFYTREIGDGRDLAGVVILSRDAEAWTVLASTNPPPVAALEAMSPGLAALIRDGRVQAALCPAPRVHVVRKGEQLSAEQMFEQRFMIVTRENLPEILRRHPAWRPAPPEREPGDTP